MSVLNKYLADAGICSRRKAVDIIKKGSVQVNGVIVREPGYKVKPTDKVVVGDTHIRNEEKVYILLNKPKDYITTVADEKGRRTVMDLVEGATHVRLYPVGRLDRNTTGLLILTNDGELAHILSHPSHEINKVYEVTIHPGITPGALAAIKQGIPLEDGVVEVDEVEVIPGTKNTVIGLLLHSGRNRIVRRIFEYLGYEINKLDRIGYAGLTKTGLAQGSWRYLTNQEIQDLKAIKSSSAESADESAE
jgi:23S rRNA pseudouridine2605 synthase